MPLTKKGSEIMSSMRKQYGAKKGKSVFYASKNAGKIKGVDHGFYGHLGKINSEGKGISCYGIGCEMRDCK